MHCSHPPAAAVLQSSAAFRKLSHLTEKVSRKLFLQDSLLGDKVKQILARLRSLHHNDEAVVPLEEVEQLHHAVHGADPVHEANLERDPLQPDLKCYMEMINFSALHPHLI